MCTCGVAFAACARGAEDGGKPAWAATHLRQIGRLGALFQVHWTISSDRVY
jgi:hypothetical protein